MTDDKALTREQRIQQEFEEDAAALVESFREPMILGLTNATLDALLNGHRISEDDWPVTLLRAIYDALGWAILDEIREEVQQSAWEAAHLPSDMVAEMSEETRKEWKEREESAAGIDNVLFWGRGWPENEEQAKQWWDEMDAETAEELGE